MKHHMLMTLAALVLASTAARADDTDTQVEHLSTALDLSDEQATNIRALLDSARKRTIKASAEIEVTSIDLRRELERVEPDEAKLEKHIDRISALEAEVRKARVVVWVKIGKVLSVKQRKKLEGGATSGSSGSSGNANPFDDSDGSGLGDPTIKDPFADHDRGDSATGRLAIASNPWAKVYVDGRLVGNTPLEMAVSAGRHKVTLVWEDTSAKKSMTVDVKAGKTQKLVVRP